MKRKGPRVIGWKEYVEFPDWNVRAKTKIDTGARTSAIHVQSYRIFHDRSGGPIVELTMALSRRHPERLTIVETPMLGTVVVTDSGGHREERPVIRTTISLGPVKKEILATVTNRARMLFRVLLGRKALEGDFVVDPAQKYLMKVRQ